MSECLAQRSLSTNNERRDTQTVRELLERTKAVRVFGGTRKVRGGKVNTERVSDGLMTIKFSKKIMNERFATYRTLRSKRIPRIM